MYFMGRGTSGIDDGEGCVRLFQMFSGSDLQEIIFVIYSHCFLTYVSSLSAEKLYLDKTHMSDPCSSY